MNPNKKLKKYFKSDEDFKNCIQGFKTMHTPKLMDDLFEVVTEVRIALRPWEGFLVSNTLISDMMLVLDKYITQ